MTLLLQPCWLIVDKKLTWSLSVNNSNTRKMANWRLLLYFFSTKLMHGKQIFVDKNFHWDEYFVLAVAVDCQKSCVSECEDGWEEEGGKCYFFSQDELTWVKAEEECKSHGSHLASVTNQKTDDFLARKCKKGKSFKGPTRSKNPNEKEA